MSLIYVVTRDGIQVSHIEAICTAKSRAIKTAIEMAKIDKDNYHQHNVIEIAVNWFYFQRPEHDNIGKQIGGIQKGGEFVFYEN